ncbi:MAG: RNA polymerase sigma factor [Agathobacter sp.]
MPQYKKDYILKKCEKLFTLCCIGIWKNQKRKYAWRNRIAPQEELSENTAGTQPDMGGDALLSYLDRERNQAVQEAVDRLDEKYRIPILLFYMEELSLKEIAAALGIPVGTVKSRLNCARKSLEKDLEEYMDE